LVQEFVPITLIPQVVLAQVIIILVIDLQQEQAAYLLDNSPQAQATIQATLIQQVVLALATLTPQVYLVQVITPATVPQQEAPAQRVPQPQPQTSLVDNFPSALAPAPAPPSQPVVSLPVPASPSQQTVSHPVQVAVQALTHQLEDVNSHVNFPPAQVAAPQLVDSQQGPVSRILPMDSYQE
jgi:hypothetical protein